jgi:hypothetical protein
VATKSTISYFSPDGTGSEDVVYSKASLREDQLSNEILRLRFTFPSRTRYLHSDLWRGSEYIDGDEQTYYSHLILIESLLGVGFIKFLHDSITSFTFNLSTHYSFEEAQILFDLIVGRGLANGKWKSLRLHLDDYLTWFMDSRFFYFLQKKRFNYLNSTLPLTYMMDLQEGARLASAYDSTAKALFIRKTTTYLKSMNQPINRDFQKLRLDADLLEMRGIAEVYLVSLEASLMRQIVSLLFALSEDDKLTLQVESRQLFQQIQEQHIPISYLDQPVKSLFQVLLDKLSRSFQNERFLKLIDAAKDSKTEKDWFKFNILSPYYLSQFTRDSIMQEKSYIGLSLQELAVLFHTKIA